MKNLIIETVNGAVDFITDTEVRLVEVTGVGAIGQINTQSQEWLFECHHL